MVVIHDALGGRQKCGKSFPQSMLMINKEVRRIRNFAMELYIIENKHVTYFSGDAYKKKGITS
jgi:hypothetical protein